MDSEDLEDLYENAPCGYLSMRADGTIVKVNRTLCAWLGKPAEEILGKKLRDLLNVAGRIFYETHFAPLLRMQGFFNEVALDLVAADGSLLTSIANAAERRDAEGNVVFIRMAIFRATQRRQYERDLVEAQRAEHEVRRQLEETAGLREQFLAVLGHDLRNPLAAIDSGRRMLEREDLDQKTARIVRLMGDSIGRMGGLIDNLMDLARGRLGGGIGIDITKGERLEPTLAQVVNELRASHPEREIEMHFQLSTPVDVDHGRIAQMFSNLLVNAATHGAEDQPIAVLAEIVEQHLEISVKNGGEPIPPAALERLFLPFYRGEVRPSAQGLGLGLYIASQIAQAHGGRIDVHSDEDETRFTFRMPVSSTSSLA